MPVPPPVIAVLPLAGSEAAVTDSVSPASGAKGALARGATGLGPGVTDSVAPAGGAKVSLARGSTGLGPESSATVAASSMATGGSFRLVTVTATVAVSVPPLPSEIV